MKLFSCRSFVSSSFTVAAAFLTTMTMMMKTASAAPIGSCHEQLPCFDISVRSVPSTSCGSSFPCQYTVCMKFNFNKPDCIKEAHETLTLTCETPRDECILDRYRYANPYNTSQVWPVTGVRNGYEQCQTVQPGGIAEFLINDGDGRCGFSPSGASAGASSLLCIKFGDPTCADPMVPDQRPCVWYVGVPETCGQNHGGGDGDPHLRLWNGTRYSYHGECDLVLLDNKDFHYGLGMDIHIRTTHEAFYSYIQEAAIRIGTDILEFAGDDFYINGVLGSDSDLPTTIGGGGGNDDSSLFRLNPPTFTETGKAKHYVLDLNHGDYILFYKYKQFMGVQVHGQPQDFATSIGLLGNYYTSQMLARDGKTVLHNADEFGAEWQVQPGDKNVQLFRTVRAPQHPQASCKPVPETQSRRRRLHEEEEDSELAQAAEEACAKKSSLDFDFCVQDVLATKDLGMAEVW